MKQTILITGGTGFLGRRLGVALKARYNVILTGRNNKQNLFAQNFTGCLILPMDVTNIESIRDVVAETKPEIIIHAAATKFVDIAEKQPLECVDVNCIGSQNIARVAIDKNVNCVIGISTDKASPPIRNTYGLSKALMERVFCSLNGKTNTKFTCVRYGNVAWSTGSVLPLWKKMHDSTNVIGTTGPEMRRFFFTVNEAVELVIAALDNIETIQGKVLSREMKSAQIKDILDIWIKHKGGTWKKIEGRPGERSDEYLIGEAELPFACTAEYNNMVYYVISFNQKISKPLTKVVSSENATRLSEEEILSIINNPPMEEL